MFAAPRATGSRRRWRIEHADCLDALPRLEAESVDVIISDPPYGIGLGGVAWDGRAIKRAAGSQFNSRKKDSSLSGALAYQAFCSRWASECLRVLKPGGHLAAFGAPRTAHRLACGLEEGGFELRDMLIWLYGTGFPKSRNLTGRMRGWGTALKPAHEPILLARKPPHGGTQANAMRHGTGALHIDACRIPHEPKCCPGQGRAHRRAALSHAPSCAEGSCERDCPAALLGERRRFFYCTKPSRSERDAGCDQLVRRRIQTFQIGRANGQKAKAKPVANIHPTVKPLELMRWLVRLLAPPDGLVLDPFAGSGSTGAAAVLEGVRFLGIESEAQYVPIARARIAHWAAVGRRRPRGASGAD